MKSVAAIKVAGLLFAATGLGVELDQWEVIVPPSTYLTLLDVTYAVGTFVVAGETSTQNGVDAEIFTSRDGARWTRQISGVRGVLSGTAYGDNKFVSVGGGYADPDFTDLILTSPDGANWTRRFAGISNHLFDVCYGNGSFVAVGLRGAVITSPDGAAWVDRSLPSDPGLALLGVASGGGSFVVVGYSDPPGGNNPQALILTSTNGVQWTRRTFLPPRLRDVAYGNGRFVAVGEFDRILHSTNGVTWSASATGVYDHLLAIIFSEGRFIAVGHNGRVTSSIDGVNWVLHRRGTEGLNGIACGNGTYVAVDYEGAILRTPPPNAPPVAMVEVSPAAESFSVPPEYVVISPNGMNATVNLSGEGSSDPDGDALNFLWLRHEADGSTVEVAPTEETTVVLPLGQHNFTLRVSDPVEADTYGFQIHVITVSEALEHVLALVEESDLPRRDKQPLIMLLRSAQRPFENGDIESGLHHLDRLQRKIEARLLDTNPELAQSLIAALNDIRAAF